MHLTYNWKIRNKGMLLMAAMVFPLALCSSVVDYHIHKNDLIRRIDTQLLTAATFAKATLPDDYHDRITGSNSVSRAEFDRIVDRNNRLCEELGLEYIWSLMLVDGCPRFTTSTSPDKKVDNGLHAGFYERHTNPEIYAETFATMQPQFQINDDKWGKIRAALIPHYDANGRKYLFGASVKVSDIKLFTPLLVRDSLLTMLVFLLPGLPISILVADRLTARISKLAESAEVMALGDYQNEIKIRGSYEINVLAHQLNIMREAILKQIGSLQDTLTQLQRFKAIVNSSPMIVFRLKVAPGWPVEFITENVKQLGYSAEDLMSGKTSWYSINYPDDIAGVEKIVFENREAGHMTYNLEARLVTASGEIRWVENWNRFIKNGDGEVTHIQGVLHDITDVKAVRLQMTEVQNILNASPILLYKVKYDDPFTPAFISDNYSMLGYNLEDIRSGALPWTQIVPEEDLALVNTNIEKALESGRDSYDLICRMIWADGEAHWYQGWNQILRDDAGNPTHIQGIQTDITALKRAQERQNQYQERLKALARELTLTEERERRQLAVELHDDLGQMLVALNMKISVLHETRDRTLINQLMPQVDDLLERLLSACKTLTWQLSPPSLYEFDICAGLERIAGDIKSMFGLEVALECDDQSMKINRALLALLFRCTRELLINVAKHSGSKNAAVTLCVEKNAIQLTVTDTGSGFNPDEQEMTGSNHDGFGLFSIGERLEYIGGKMSIESAPVTGTSVTLHIPITEEDEVADSSRANV